MEIIFIIKQQVNLTHLTIHNFPVESIYGRPGNHYHYHEPLCFDYYNHNLAIYSV